MDNCYSKYIKFKTTSTKESNFLQSSNSIIGDQFQIDSNKIINKFNQGIGEIDLDVAREITILKNKNFEINVFLTFVAYTQGSLHWGEILVIAYDKKLDCFKNFVSGIQSRLEQGNRPKFTLDKYSVNKIIETNGSWQPKELMKTPELDENSALIKTKMTFTERLIEAGRRKNPGCYIGSFIFLTVLAGLIFCLIMTFFGF